MNAKDGAVFHDHRSFSSHGHNKRPSGTDEQSWSCGNGNRHIREDRDEEAAENGKRETVFKTGLTGLHPDICRSLFGLSNFLFAEFDTSLTSEKHKPAVMFRAPVGGLRVLSLLVFV